jgi:hypothetical protein
MASHQHLCCRQVQLSSCRLRSCVSMLQAAQLRTHAAGCASQRLGRAQQGNSWDGLGVMQGCSVFGGMACDLDFCGCCVFTMHARVLII